MVKEEIDRIHKVRKRAFNLVKKKKFKAALRKLKLIEDSWAVSEARNATTLIRAYCLYMRGKKRAARKMCRDNLAYVWNDFDGLFFCRSSNPQIDLNSGAYKIVIKGGRACFGFTQFSNEHMCKFKVIANDEFEACRYIDELVEFGDINNRVVVEIQRTALDKPINDRRGVYWCSSFWVDTEISSAPAWC